MDRLSDIGGALSRDPGLRILLSAYACEPGKGSEPGIGWKWALNLAAAGHEVWVVTRENNRPSIESALRQQPVAGLRFAYYDLPSWARWWKKGGRGVHLYYLLWQWGAFGAARRLCRQTDFDLVHHITFGVFRQPSFMAFLGLPFVFGPLGGGERAPRALRRGFPLGGRLRDALRDVANAVARFDPLMRAVYRRCTVILCKTRETLESIPSRYRGKCRLQLEIGTDYRDLYEQGPQPPEASAGLRVLYVGRLVYMKGLHLGLRAFASLLRRYDDARLTIVGTGPEEPRLRRLAGQLGIAHAVRWVPWLPQREVMAVYPRHDAFLFPSLHDSSGNAVLEALSCGLPVVCLDLGGPGVLVDGSCGVRVSGSDEDAVTVELSRALQTLADDEILRQRLARGALMRANENFSWFNQTERMNCVYAAAVAPHGVAGDVRP